MSDSVLTILKICFLAVLYLFIARVVRAVWVEIFTERSAAGNAGTARPDPRADPGVTVRAPRGSSSKATTVAPPVATGKTKRRDRRSGKALAGPGHLVIVEPPDQKGESFALADEITVGRGAGCGVFVDDTFASGLHARVFRRDGQLFVEDLGSTNGTWLNRKRVHGPIPIHKGDRLQVGNTVLELRP